MKIFISYAREDIKVARKLYQDLTRAGVDAWMDEKKLRIGQNWQFMIRKAISESTYFLALLSSNSLNKRGYVQKELKMALDILDEFPPEDVFILPARLDECRPEDEKLKNLHWADMFPSYERGLKSILQAVDPDYQFEPETVNSEITNTLGMKFVLIEPGEFMMGSPPDEPERDDDEKQHKVILTQRFYMQTTQVTQGQWETLMGNNPSYFKKCGDNCPVERISWDDAQEFIKHLNQIEGIQKYRLPTEAEWEYAARAGTSTPFAFGKCLSTN
jgi:formylglycine-generating enzyme required for sulfatase activity